jgi:hypothetical protein
VPPQASLAQQRSRRGVTFPHKCAQDTAEEASPKACKAADTSSAMAAGCTTVRDVKFEMRPHESGRGWGGGGGWGGRLSTGSLVAQMQASEDPPGCFPGQETLPWSEEDDRILRQAHTELGNRWMEICKVIDFVCVCVRARARARVRSECCAIPALAPDHLTFHEINIPWIFGFS